MKKSLLAVGLLLFAGCAEFAADISRRVDEARVKTKVLFLAHLDIAWPKSTANFAKALAFCRAENVDAVVVVGDPTLKQQKNQYEVFQAAYRKAFAGVRAPQLILATNDQACSVGTFAFDVRQKRPFAPCKRPTFYAEGRLSLTDDLCIYPVGWNAFHVGSMHGVEGILGPKETPADAKVTAQGLFVKDYGDRLQLRRCDFIRGEDLAEPWQWPMDEASARAKVAPQFWADTRLECTKGYDGKGEPMYTLRWPNLLARHVGMRALSYELTLLVDGRLALETQVQSKGFYLNEERDGDAVRFAFLRRALHSDAPFTVRVVPVSSFGVRGKPLEAGPFN